MMTSRICVRVALWCSVVVALVLSRTALAESLSSARMLPAPSMDSPDYLVPSVDSSLGTTFVRVTIPESPMGNGLACKRPYCTQRYSSSPSPDGSQIIWSSNWGQRGGPVFDFVSRADWADWDSVNG